MLLGTSITSLLAILGDYLLPFGWPRSGLERPSMKPGHVPGSPQPPALTFVKASAPYCEWISPEIHRCIFEVWSTFGTNLS
jgi:hypothetical protein